LNPESAVALVTGGATRVGRAISLALAARNATVAIHYRSSDREAREVTDLINNSGGNAHCFQADLSDPDQIDSLVPAVIKQFGSLNVLINSASVYVQGGLDSTTRTDWEQNMLVHAWAPFRLSQMMIAALEDAPGKVININDAKLVKPNRFAYSVSKASLVAVTRTLAAAVGPNVQVNQVALGAILPPSDLAEDRVAAIAKTIPAQRWGHPDDVTAAILHLIESDYINAETIHIDGGFNGTNG
jgi:NAD(P)-dependent dehydrogenase (short-subunit alcohol dehydrogenase family)